MRDLIEATFAFILQSAEQNTQRPIVIQRREGGRRRPPSDGPALTVRIPLQAEEPKPGS
jgi:hypothetical protein